MGTCNNCIQVNMSRDHNPTGGGGGEGGWSFLESIVPSVNFECLMYVHVQKNRMLFVWVGRCAKVAICSGDKEELMNAVLP